MSASAAFAEMLDELGIWWPRGNGDALRSAADGWQQTAEVIDEIAVVLDTVARTVIDNYQGEAATRFAEMWQKWSGDAGHLATTAADARRLAAALIDFGGDIDVADRTLVQLIEQALQAPPPAPVAVPMPSDPTQLSGEWLEWLRECAAMMRNELSSRAVTRNEMLGDVAYCELPPAPGDRPDLATIMPTAITWPDPGTPIDVGAIATDPVDFGAGEGRLPQDIPGVTPGVGDIPGLTGAVGGGPVNIVIVGDNNTVTVETSDVSPLPTASPIDVPSTELPPLDEVPPVEELPPAEEPLPEFGGLGGGGGAGFGGGGGYSPPEFDMPSFEPDLPPLEDIAPLQNSEVPVTFDPPVGAPVAIGAAGAAAAGVAGKKSGAALPFMPMGGATAGGDETPEPKRKARRRA
jgi:uncharacterized protein YukE